MRSDLLQILRSLDEGQTVQFSREGSTVCVKTSKGTSFVRNLTPVNLLDEQAGDLVLFTFFSQQQALMNQPKKQSVERASMSEEEHDFTRSFILILLALAASSAVMSWGGLWSFQ